MSPVKGPCCAWTSVSPLVNEGLHSRNLVFPFWPDVSNQEHRQGRLHALSWSCHQRAGGSVINTSLMGGSCHCIDVN